MKCPNDQTEMEKGRLAPRGDTWIKIDNNNIFQKADKLLLKDKIVFAWRCPKCGKVELKSDITP